LESNIEVTKKGCKEQRILEILCKQSVLLGRANAIQPEIKAKRGRMRKFKFGLKANWGGLVKELGCQIVTQKTGSEVG
jgi:hypothetical protein